MVTAAAIKAIEKVHPPLGRHLKASVRTGRHVCTNGRRRHLADVIWHRQVAVGASLVQRGTGPAPQNQRGRTGDLDRGPDRHRSARRSAVHCGTRHRQVLPRTRRAPDTADILPIEHTFWKFYRLNP
jgi:hypothetical protein